MYAYIWWYSFHNMQASKASPNLPKKIKSNQNKSLEKLWHVLQSYLRIYDNRALVSVNPLTLLTLLYVVLLQDTFIIIVESGSALSKNIWTDMARNNDSYASSAWFIIIVIFIGIFSIEQLKVYIKGKRVWYDMIWYIIWYIIYMISYIWYIIYDIWYDILYDMIS